MNKFRDKLLFGGNGETAILRDGQECVKCGMTRAEHKERYSRDITVDHIDGRGRYTPKNERNNALANLQTLCLPCHGKKDRVRRTTEIKLTNKEVKEIRRRYASGGVFQHQLATEYGVTQPYVHLLVKNINRKS